MAGWGLCRGLGLAALVLLANCGAPRAPESLEELRMVVAGEPFGAARQAAPDLAAEAERSLALAEGALEDRDSALLRRMALLGHIQARTAFAHARQQAARQRLLEAQRGRLRAEEDLARYRSQREDSLREIERLEGL